MRRALALALLALVPMGALAEDLRALAYDAAADSLVAEIAYRGTHPGHRFAIEWGRCSDDRPAHVAGRIVDRQGRDPAREDYRVEARFGLAELPCRPALVTLRLGRVAHAQAFVPAAPD